MKSQNYQKFVSLCHSHMIAILQVNKVKYKHFDARLFQNKCCRPVHKIPSQRDQSAQQKQFWADLLMRTSLCSPLERYFEIIKA